MLNADAPANDRDRERPPASIGMFDRPEWGGGFFAEFGADEVVRVRQPIPSIVVQSIGRPLPPFVSATLYVDHEPDWELDLIYEAPWLDVAPICPPPRFGYVRPRHRIVVGEQSVVDGLSGAGAPLEAELVIAVDSAGFAALAEALAILITCTLLIGLDFAEPLARAAAGPEGTARAWAYVQTGFGTPDTVADLSAWIERAAREGFAGDLLLMQLVGGNEGARLRLSALDAHWQAVLAGAPERTAWATASLEASVTATIVIAFAGQSPAAHADLTRRSSESGTDGGIDT